jgi:hypothetical protein
MSINKDLNVDPYYDDFDETKQFNRVLFKPSRAVQARELTQLQTILQKQVERFGSNVYKEGTIISGINLTSRSDLKYIKLQDQVGFNDPSIYDEFEITDTNDANFGSTSRFILEGQSSNIRAEIVKGLGGFETQAPNLKTFFINYLNANLETGQKKFIKGEKLNLLKPDNGSGVFEQVKIDNANVTFTADNSSDEYAGDSFGVSCEEGVIYQKGHFIFVERQLVIVSRYTNTPENVSVGFTVNENIIDSNLDSSLLDNATGFNNQNAPGADRLQLVPILTSVATASEPAEFFALIRYVDGNATRLRNFTEFNVIGDELARRTYEESGNYVVNGLATTLNTVTSTNDVGQEIATAQAEVQPGKAYVFGREVTNVTTKKLNIDPVTTTKTKLSQRTSVDYGQYFTFNSAAGQGVIDFNLEPNVIYPKMALYANTQKVGFCNVASVEPGRIYVFNLVKTANVVPTHILPNAPTLLGGFNIGTASKVALTNGGVLQERTKGCYIFKTGQNNLNSITNTNLVRRAKTSTDVDLQTSDRVVTIPATLITQPIADASTIFAINNDLIYPASSVQMNTSPNASGFTSMTVTFGSSAPASAVVHYQEVVKDTAADTLAEENAMVYTKFDLTNKKATLGVPNAIQLVSVGLTDATEGKSTPDADIVDVTSKFRLVNNQTDTHYDLSYIQLKSGEEPVADNAILLVEFKYLSRSSANGNGYLTASSYASITSLRHLINDYSSKSLDLYSLLDSYDMRPYKRNIVDPASSRANAGAATSLVGNGGTLAYADSLSSEVEVLGKTLFGNSSVINSTYNYTLSRTDSVVIDEYGEISIVKGDEAEAPQAPQLDRQYPISSIFVPGNTAKVNGSNPITVLDKKNKTYTMKDIEELEMKVENLSNIVQLSLAEVQAKSLIVRNSDGNERFKNGILVDKFQSFRGAQLFDPEFSSAIDETRTVAMPAIREFPVDLKIDPASTLLVNANVSTSETGFDDILSLVPDATRVKIIDQPYATNFRSCVSNYYSYQGQADIYPKFSSNRDVIQNPAVNFDIDLQGPLLDLVDGIQEFMPLTREVGTVGDPRLINQSWAREQVEVSAGRRGTRTVTRTVRTQNFAEGIEMQSLTATPRTEEQTFGNFVTDVRMKPYLPSTAIRIFVAGLRPNTRHYFFFDETDVNDHIIPLKDLAKYNTSGRRSSARHQTGRYRFGSLRTERRVKGKAVYTNSKGQLRAVFEMPAGKFFVGENDLEIVDVDQYSSIESASTSYAKATYRGYNFALNKSEINVTTRTVDFDVSTNIIERQFQVKTVDPIAQTFRIKSSDTNGANFTFISDVDVYFKRKDTSVGVTLQLREVLNGYPTSKVLPFGVKHLESQDVLVSANGTSATKFAFDNPVKLKADTEYCFVVIPDGNSPEYLIFTAKVGSTSLSKGSVASQLPVVNDWGDGVLFTSTNDSAWKSYQDEDLKFCINRFNFSESSGTVDLVPNDVEFLTIRDNAKVTVSDSNSGGVNTRKTLHFQNDESVYILPESGNITTAVVQPGELTTLNIAVGLGSDNFPFADGDYLFIVANDDPNEKIVAQIENFSDGATEGTTDILIDTPFFTTGNVNVQLCVYGEVSYYNPRNQSKIHLKNSSATATNFIDNLPNSVFSDDLANRFIAGKTYTITNLGDAGPDRTTAWREVGVPSNIVPQVGTVFVATGTGNSTTLPGHNGTARENSHKIYGMTSGASATITSTDVQKLSYFQSEIMVDNTSNTSTDIELFKKSGADLISDKTIEKSSNIYCLDEPKGITSKSERLRNGDSEDFVLRASLNNNGFEAVTPIIDSELSSINAYEYKITDDEDNTSAWVTKEVILKDELPAEGLKVKLSAYRPAGTEIDVYSRFVRQDNSEIASDWEELVLSNPKEYSISGNIYDYRDYEYDLTESALPPKYNTFQLKILFRHSNAAELQPSELRDITPDVNLFPHLYSITAIALTG